jgi:HTH-type transcriptional regulator/antitoxin HigA
MTTFSGPTLNLEHVQAAWQGLTQHVPLGPILTEKDYTQRVQLLDSLLDAIGTNEAHPLGDLLDLLATQIEAYERQQPTMPEATPIEVLRYLMEEHGLTQTDMAEDLGGQSVVSAILRGKRQLNAQHIAALAARFHVSPAVFFSPGSE